MVGTTKLMAVTGIPEAVATKIPEVPTTRSGGCLGGRLRADAGAVSTRGNFKRLDTDATGIPGPGVNKVLRACGVEELSVGGVQSNLLKLLLCLLLEGWVLAE